MRELLQTKLENFVDYSDKNTLTTSRTLLKEPDYSGKILMEARGQELFQHAL